MIAIDFGVNDKFVLYGEDGLIELPKQKGGSKRGVAGKLEYQLENALALDDVTIESASIGSSGLEAEAVGEIIERCPHELYIMSGRAVKNKHGKNVDDKLAAQTIYEIATTHPERLKVWRYAPKQSKLIREHTSVRPHDQRAYRGAQVDEWMKALPSAADLPEPLQRWFVDKKKTKSDYYLSKVVPFAIAMSEPSVVNRASFEHVIGLSEHGYPSFYRRATVALMQKVAKDTTGKTKNGDITPAERKEAWKECRRTLRHLYSVMKARS